MTWTTSPPREPGFYLWDDGEFVRAIRVDPFGDAYGERIDDWSADKLTGRFMPIPSAEALAESIDALTIIKEKCVQYGDAPWLCETEQRAALIFVSRHATQALAALDAARKETE